jgi:CRP-like cAMP-binding protein
MHLALQPSIPGLFIFGVLMTVLKSRIPQLLGRLPLFDEFSQDELAQVAQAVSEVEVARGGVVFRRGDPCTGFHCVVYGQVKLAVASPEGDEKVVRIAGPGDSFGEALMFLGKPYIVSAQALADTLLLFVPQATVFDGLERDGRFARKMLAGLSRRLQGLVADVEAYSLRSGAQRVIGYLLRAQALEQGPRVSLDVSKAVLASRLNLTPEHFSRILHDLSTAGLIEVQGRDITLLDLERLRAYG